MPQLSPQGKAFIELQFRSILRTTPSIGIPARIGIPVELPPLMRSRVLKPGPNDNRSEMRLRAARKTGRETPSLAESQSLRIGVFRPCPFVEIGYQ